MTIRLKNIDGELYLDRIKVLFFRNDKIPEKYSDPLKYNVQRIPIDRKDTSGEIKPYKIIERRKK